MDVSNDTLQIVAGASIMVATLWYYFYGPGLTDSGGEPGAPAARLPAARRRRQVADADVQRVVEAFPAVSPAAARYSLEQTASVEATCNRVLERGFLPEPPAGYYPTSAPAPATAARPAALAKPKAGPQTLIEKLGLQDRVADENDDPAASTAPTATEKGKSKAWSASAEDRESVLHQRKVDMVLEARRKVQQKDRQGKTPA